ncbi:HAD family hydrolase [Microvirga solisilvae]|uniref:HAD family hydrolase n=1 Tax=Microvirga solisilvae TaxID=2919498 RepID=UPI001FAF17F2|nr:HAD family hydrolase [Microvirga solisilvae]
MRGKVFLFDMDGTLIDSTEVIEEIWHRWAARHGIDGHAVLAKSHGRQAIQTVKLFGPEGIDLEAETAWFNEQAALGTDRIKPVTGAKEFLSKLEPHEWAIVTSANRPLAESWLAAAGLPQPETFIAAEDVSRSKPDPEGYRKAAEILGFDPTDAIVFEDAQAGMEAGRGAGAKVVGIGPSNHLAHLADSWIADFRQIEAFREASGGFRLQF